MSIFWRNFLAVVLIVFLFCFAMPLGIMVADKKLKELATCQSIPSTSNTKY